MKEDLKRFFFGGDSFKKEFKSEVRLLIMFTLGFTIAFTWRQTIFDTTQNLVSLITNITNSTSLSILSSICITITSLILIWIISKTLEE